MSPLYNEHPGVRLDDCFEDQITLMLREVRQHIEAETEEEDALGRMARLFEQPYQRRLAKLFRQGYRKAANAYQGHSPSETAHVFYQIEKAVDRYIAMEPHGDTLEISFVRKTLAFDIRLREAYEPY